VRDSWDSFPDIHARRCPDDDGFSIVSVEHDHGMRKATSPTK
jgi:hypothetical protein